MTPEQAAETARSIIRTVMAHYGITEEPPATPIDGGMVGTALQGGQMIYEAAMNYAVEHAPSAVAGMLGALNGAAATAQAKEDAATSALGGGIGGYVPPQEEGGK